MTRSTGSEGTAGSSRGEEEGTLVEDLGQHSAGPENSSGMRARQGVAVSSERLSEGGQARHAAVVSQEASCPDRHDRAHCDC